MDQVNSGSTKAQAIFDDAILYPNPYMVVTRKGYTKHYYAGAERLATVIGGGGFGGMLSPIDKPTQQEQEIVYAFNNQYQQPDPFWQGKVMSCPVPTEDIKGEQRGELEYICKPTILDYVDVQLMPDILLKPISVYDQLNSKTEDIFFSHSDHLGSANWITDVGGNPIQYIHYAPYGELIDNQHASGSWYDERYKFTGKERDAETGYYAFGARYWWIVGTWLSVDPLSDKYPQISPYAYCNWNPMRYIDPDGRDIYRYDDETGDIKLYMKTDDNFDQFGKFKYNSETGEYELQTNMDGSIKTYTDHRGNNDKIAKGILRNELNIKQKGSSFISDNNAGPTITDYYNFALILDEVTGVEISGYVLEAPGEKNRKIVQFEPYKENSYNRSVNRLMKFFPYSVLKHFHTHGHADSYIDATTPSEDYDIPFKNKITSLYPDIQLLILHNHGSPIRY